jgi:hypothetical protein
MIKVSNVSFVSATVAVLLASSSARAQVTTLGADAPQPKSDTSSEESAGVSPTMPTEITKEGWCVATANTESPSDATEAQQAAHQACLDTLIHRRPVPLVQTPGSFFVGYVWGEKSKQFVYGPQVGLGVAVLFPLHRPRLKYQLAPATSATGTARKWQFSLPTDMAFAADIAVSLNANLASFTFPNAPSETDSTDTGTTQEALGAVPNLIAENKAISITCA